MYTLNESKTKGGCKVSIKNNIKAIKGRNINEIVAELIHISDYYYNPEKYYHFFKLQGGTIWQLAAYILQYNRGGNDVSLL